MPPYYKNMTWFCCCFWMRAKKLASKGLLLGFDDEFRSVPLLNTKGFLCIDELYEIQTCVWSGRSGINRLGLVYRPSDIDFALYKKWWSIADYYFGVSVRHFDSFSDNTFSRKIMQWWRFVNHYFLLHA